MVRDTGIFFYQFVVLASVVMGLFFLGACGIQRAGEGIGDAIHGPAPILYQQTTNNIDNSRTTKLFSDNVVKILSDNIVASNNPKTTTTTTTSVSDGSAEAAAFVLLLGAMALGSMLFILTVK